jgi:hypothetical protein
MTPCDPKDLPQKMGVIPMMELNKIKKSTVERASTGSLVPPSITPPVGEYNPTTPSPPRKVVVAQDPVVVRSFNLNGYQRPVVQQVHPIDFEISSYHSLQDEVMETEFDDDGIDFRSVGEVGVVTVQPTATQKAVNIRKPKPKRMFGLVAPPVNFVPEAGECSEEVAKLVNTHEHALNDVMAKAHMNRNNRTAEVITKKTLLRLDDATKSLWIEELAVEVAFEPVSMAGFRQMRDVVRRRARKDGVTIYIDDLITIVEGIITTQHKLLAMAEDWATNKVTMEQIGKLQALANGQLLGGTANMFSRCFTSVSSAATGVCAPIIGSKSVNLSATAPSVPLK